MPVEPVQPSRGGGKRAAAQQRIAAKRAAEAAARAAAERRRRTVIGAVVAAVVLVVALVAVVLVQTQRTQTPVDSAAPANTVDGGTAVALGPPDAPVTVDVYEDFQCPVCQQFEAGTGQTLDQLMADGTISVHYHPIAFLDRASSTEYSTRALNAAAVVLDTAGTQAFEEFHDLLFADQPAEGSAGLTDDQLISYAGQAGATGPTVAADIRDRTYEGWTQRVTDQSSKDGITGTPTIKVNGTELSAAQRTPEGLTAAVQAAAAA